MILECSILVQNIMNFHRKLPFALFAIATLACLLAQIEETPPWGMEDECQGGGVNEDGEMEMHEGEGVMHGSAGIQQAKTYLTASQDQITPPLPSKLPQNPHRRIQPKGKPNICSSRLLQTTPTTNNLFLRGCTATFSALLLITRNLIFVGMLTNTVDLFLPVVLLGECFLMLGLWTCQKHYLSVLYGNVFGSYWDCFNAIRLLIQPSIDAGTLPQLSQYGFSPLIIFNLSGEISIAILLLVFTVLSRLCAALFRHQRMRKMAGCLRPVWNGYFFSILPRVATFTGLHWRLVGVGAGYDGINGTVCGVLSGAMLFYFIALIVQTRRANSKVQRIEEGVAGIGLMRRIDLRRDFEFDCLRYSALYFPCMNFLRVIGYFLPIGLFWDYYYLSYGGAIMGQLFILMAEVSSTGYLLRRDKVLFPLQNFLLVVVHLSLITVGLAESVQHSEVSQVAQTVLFAVFGFVFGSAMISVGIDAWVQLKTRCCSPEQAGSEDQIDGQSAQNFTRQLGKSSTICQAKRHEDLDEEQCSNQDEIIGDTNASFKTTEKPLKLKIKKVRKGKVI